jgi:hypothetical protein
MQLTKDGFNQGDKDKEITWEYLPKASNRKVPEGSKESVQGFMIHY